jgi:hypothetical protein
MKGFVTFFLLETGGDGNPETGVIQSSVQMLSLFLVREMLPLADSFGASN